MFPALEAVQIAKNVSVSNDPAFAGNVIAAVPFVIAAPPELVGKFVVFAVIETRAYPV